MFCKFLGSWNVMLSFAIKWDIFLGFQESVNNKQHLDYKGNEQLSFRKGKWMVNKQTGLSENHTTTSLGRERIPI